MKNYLIAAAVASLFISCEEKNTTINPPGDKDTTIIRESPTSTEKKTETETKTTPGGTTTETKETTEQR